MGFGLKIFRFHLRFALPELALYPLLLKLKLKMD
jgi:hypothetical protein